MKPSVKLGKMFGVEIGLHYSWFLLAALFVAGLSGHFRAVSPGAGAPLIWLSALAAAAAFFVGLLLHELSHVAVARSRGLAVRGVTLFALGGVAETGEDARDPGSEFLIGVVGPAASAVLGLACLAADALLPDAGAILKAALRWLGSINLMLAAFNLLPAYPMDGGRLLRAAIWKATGSRSRGTRSAAAAGQVIAGMMLLAGAVGFMRGGGFGSLWLLIVGLFIFQAAALTAWTDAATGALRRLRVRDVMSEEIPAVGPDESLRRVVDEQMLRRGRHCVVVRRDGALLGLLTPEDVGRVAREAWLATPARGAMVPAERVRTIPDTASAFDAAELMGREGLAQLPVVDDGRLVGIIAQADIARALRTRRELEAGAPSSDEP